MAEWSTGSGKHSYEAVGARDVLIIVSEDVTGPDVVQRRPAIQLTEEWREKLENQGVARKYQSDDLSLVTARYSLHKSRTVSGIEMSSPGGERLTRERVLKQIKALLNKCEPKKGVILHYIGAGKRNTGDWCFEDGFITFKDLAHLYLQLLRGCVLSIVTDCSYSGSWVRECMTFLDEQGVKPCGHSAKDKGILINVAASCLSHQVPRQLAFSVHTCKNDKNTGHLTLTLKASIKLESKIADNQHVRGSNFTRVMCGNSSIDEECLCLPQATWKTWNARHSIYIMTGEDRGRKAWRMLHLVDDDKIILSYIERTQGEEAGKHATKCDDYGEKLKSGWGEHVPRDVYESVMNKFTVYKKKSDQKCAPDIP